MEALQVPMEIVRNPMQAMRDVDTSYSKEFVGGALGYVAGLVVGNLMKKKSATDSVGISSVLIGGVGFIVVHGVVSMFASEDTAAYVATASALLSGYSTTAGYSIGSMSA
jgi:hypothetical protein